VKAPLPIGLVLCALAVSAASAASGEKNVADCDQAAGGAPPADWRKEADVAGPLGILDGTLQSASRTHNGQFVAKMPLVVEGDRTVTLSVPPRLRHRVFIFYGLIIGRDGTPATGFSEATGNSATEFNPCPGRPRTAFPGGLRVKGRAPVHLLVTVQGDAGSIVLRLGRPKAIDRR
jgi:hypothetical protein